MVAVSFIYFLAQVFNCVCQFPINRPFTDRINRNGQRLHIITEGANSRILDQFRVRPSFNGQSAVTGGNVQINPNTISSVPSFVNNIQRELERFGMRNIDLFSSSPGITNPPMPVIGGTNLGNSGIIETPNKPSIQENSLTNINSGSTDSAKSVRTHLSTLGNDLSNQRRRQGGVLGNANVRRGGLQTNLNIFSATDNIHNILNSNISSANLNQDIVPILPSPFNRDPNTNAITDNNIPTNTDSMISEADLLQMGSNELAALGNRAISMSSIVDTNANSPNTQGNPNSSTEEKLIIALLERLVEIKENRRQNAIDPIPQLGGRSPTTSQSNLIPSLHQRVGNPIESAMLGTSNQLTGHQRRMAGTQINIPVQSLPCQFRGCSSGHYCVTVALSALFSEFCPASSNDVCVCTPGCNFRNRFLPENAVERIGRCRKCFCENGNIYCRYTRRCRRLYRLMGWRLPDQQMFPLNRQ